MARLREGAAEEPTDVETRRRVAFFASKYVHGMRPGASRHPDADRVPTPFDVESYDLDTDQVLDLVARVSPDDLERGWLRATKEGRPAEIAAVERLIALRRVGSKRRTVG